MSTTSRLYVICKDGKIRTSYVHFDGASHLRILISSYNTQEAAEKLISMGDISVLAPSMECPEGHSFDTPVKGFCIFYARDRMEDLETKILDKLPSNNTKEDYSYIWSSNSWTRYLKGEPFNA